MTIHGRGRSVATGALVGLIGGLAGSWLMNYFISGVALVTTRGDRMDPQRNKQLIAAAKSRYKEMADPTGEFTEAVAKRVFGRELTEKQKAISGPVAHYAFGALAGAVYGMLAEVAPTVVKGRGVPFALALWVAGDEIAVPALGLGRKPTEIPVEAHAAMFASHVVYGFTLETVRKRALDLVA